jgi:hypothetical protein
LETEKTFSNGMKMALEIFLFPIKHRLENSGNDSSQDSANLAISAPIIPGNNNNMNMNNNNLNNNNNLIINNNNQNIQSVLLKIKQLCADLDIVYKTNLQFLKKLEER